MSEFQWGIGRQSTHDKQNELAYAIMQLLVGVSHMDALVVLGSVSTAVLRLVRAEISPMEFEQLLTHLQLAMGEALQAQEDAP